MNQAAGRRTRTQPLNIIDTLDFDLETATALQLQCLRPARRPGSVHPRGAPPTAGYFHPTLKSSLQVCGSGAELWLDSAVDADVPLAALQTHASAALLLASDGSVCPHFGTLAIQYIGGAILTTPMCESRAMATLRRWATLHTPVRIVHGVLMQIHGLGVLLTGASGAGKSELALELLSRGHRLVVDDAVEVRTLGHHCLIGSSPALLNGFIEARGLGIIDVHALFGAGATVQRCRIDLVLQLAADHSPAADAAEQRLTGTRSNYPLMGETLPMISLSPRLGHNWAVVAEVACRDHWLRLSGYHADAQFIERQQRLIDDAGATPPN